MLALGTKTKWGKVAAILWIGERYYMMLDADGTVSLMPAVGIELDNSRENGYTKDERSSRGSS